MDNMPKECWVTTCPRLPSLTWTISLPLSSLLRPSSLSHTTCQSDSFSERWRSIHWRWSSSGMSQLILPLYHLLYSVLKWFFSKPGEPKMGHLSGRAFSYLLYLCSFFLSTTITSLYSHVFQMDRNAFRWIQTLLSHIYHNVCPAFLFRVSSFPLLW